MLVILVSKLSYPVNIRVGPREEDNIRLSPYSRSGVIDESSIVGDLPRGVIKIPA